MYTYENTNYHCFGRDPRTHIILCSPSASVNPTQCYSTDRAFIANVTTAIVTVVHARSPATITCTAILTGTITNDATLNIYWSKDGVQLHNSSELVITSSNTTTVLYHSNLTIHVLETSDSGSYSCVVVLSQSTQTPTLPPTVSTTHLVVEGSNHN